MILLFAFGSMLPFQTANAMPNVHLDYTKTTITLHETVNFTAQVSYSANITWFCDDINVQSEFSTASNYTFIPKAVGVYYIKLSVNGFTNPPPMESTKVTVIEDQTTSPTPTPYPVPTQYTTYHKGDPYTTVYYPKEIAVPNGTDYPTIEIIFPKNDAVITDSNVTLTFNLTLNSPTSYYPITLQTVSYKPSWSSENTTVELIDSGKIYSNKTMSFSIPIANAPQGEQSITVYAIALYQYETGRENVTTTYGPGPYLKGHFLNIYSNYYFIEGSSSTEFTIDTSPFATPSNLASDNNLGTFLFPIGLAVTLSFAIFTILVFFKKHRNKLSSKQSFL